MGSVQIKENEVVDTLKKSGIKIIQDRKKFCFGIDAVLLADYAKSGIRKGSAVIDLGTGTGIIPFLLSSESNAAFIKVRFNHFIFFLCFYYCRKCGCGFTV